MPKYSPAIESAFARMKGSTFKSLLVFGRPVCPDLSGEITKMSVSEIIAPHGLNSGSQAELIKAGLLIWNEEYELAHQYAQKVHSAEGSYWHAILHRRQPDYSNARYWYDRVGSHPVFHKLSKDFAGWKPETFILRCESKTRPEDIGQLLKIQVREFELLFEHTFNLAVQRRKSARPRSSGAGR